MLEPAELTLNLRTVRRLTGALCWLEARALLTASEGEAS